MNTANEALASLGLATEPAAEAITTETTSPAETATEAPTAQEEAPDAVAPEATETAPVAEAPANTDTSSSFEAGDVNDISFDELPALKRTFTGGGSTVYGIEDIAAPGTDGKKFHAKLIAYKGGDMKAFKRSVQSSATGQNTKAKEAGAPNYYVTRAAETDGQFKGVYVIRTDERPA